MNKNEQNKIDLDVTERRDIFDKLMMLPFLRIFYRFYKKYKSPLLYLFFGVLTTAVNFVIFLLLRRLLGMNELIANLLAWAGAVLFAFFTNRLYVFVSDAAGRRRVLEFLKFCGARVGTLLLEEAAIYLFVTRLSLYDIAVKAVVAVAVVILNYVFSRFLVFQKKKA